MLLLFFLFAAKNAEATTYYVDQATGIDSNNGTSTSTPWLTVQKAAAALTAGDTVQIKNGTYHEQVIPANSGTSTNPITYQAYPGNTPVISASDAITGFTSLGAQESGGLSVSGFETGDTSEFNSTTLTGTNTLTVQSSVKNNGIYAMKSTFSGVDKSSRVNKTLTATDSAFVRFYFYVDSNFDLSATSSRMDILLMRLDSSTTRARVSLYKNASNQLYLKADLLTPSTVTIYDGTSNAGEVTKGAWHYIELNYRGNNTSGGGQFWFDGISKGSNFAQNTTGLQIGRLEIGANSSSITQPTASSLMYIDDIKASNSAIGVFSAGDPSTYQKSGITWSANEVFSDRAALSSTTSAILTAGQFNLDTTNNILYVKLPGSDSPANHTMEVSHRNNVIYLNGINYNVFDGVTVEDANTSSNGGFYLVNANNNTVRNSSSHDNYGGGFEATNSSNNLVSHNTFTDNDKNFGGGVRVETFSSDNIIEYNTVTGYGGNGINIRSDSGASNRNTVRYNSLHNLLDSGVYVHDGCDATQVYGNTIYNIHISGPSAGGNGIHLGIGDTNSLVYNNLIHDVETHGISLREGSNYNLIYNNTIYNAGLKGTGSGIDLHMSTASGSANNVIKNNIVHTASASALNVDVASVTAGGNIFDNNIYYNPSNVLVKWNNVTYTTLSSYQTVSGQDSHSVNADPKFINITSNDYRLQPTSPAVNVGAFIASVQNDLLGISRPQGFYFDAGAYERVVPQIGSNLAQFKNNGTSSLTVGEATTSGTVIFSLSMSSTNSADLLTPEVEIKPVGTPFTNVPTATGSAVSFTSGNVTGTITINGITDQNYHWQARAANSEGGGPWTSFGSNNESASDFTIDTTGPSSPGTPSTTTPTTNTSQTWIWTAATDALSTIASYTWRVTDNLGNAITSGTTSTLNVLTNLGVGTWNFFVKAVDNVGNIGSESTSSLTVQGTPTPTPIPTNTPTPTATPTPIPTNTPTPTATPTPIQTTQSSNTSSSNSTTQAPSCTASSPSGVPDLFQIDVSDKQAVLYFAPVPKANNYYIAFGTTTGSEQYGAALNSGQSQGVLSFTVNYLSPNTTYFFKVRSGNDCMPGNWGNIVKIKTRGINQGGTSFYKNFLSRILAVFPKQVTPGTNGTVAKSTQVVTSNSCEYIVKPGDSLSKIAKNKLGNANAYQSIKDKNRGRYPSLKSSNIIRSGWKLQVGC